MKALFYSIVGAVVSGVILLLVQQYLSNRPEAELRQLNYQVQKDDVALDKDTLTKLTAAADQEWTRITISTVTIQNGGNRPIADQDVTIRVGVLGEGEQRESKLDEIVKVQTLSYPGKDPDSVRQSVSGNKVTFRYKVLNPGEGHRFWIAYKAIGEISISARSPGLSLVDELPNTETEEETDPLGTILKWALVIGISLLVGLVLGFLSLYSDLKQRGQNVDELLKLPKLPRKTQDSNNG